MDDHDEDHIEDDGRACLHDLTYIGGGADDDEEEVKGEIREHGGALELKNIIDNTYAFFTSGCPGCNRPYYTSKPSGPIYNYPRMLKEKEKEEIYELLHTIVN